jgi:hypothetical protein
MTPMRKIVLVFAFCVTVAGCSSAPDPGPVFDNQGNEEIACMAHQPQPPGSRYTDDATKRTDESLALLRYYTANGRKPFCDNAAPSDTDRAWARLYVQLGADRTNVAPLVG